MAPLFYFGAMSPYSWMAAERIDALIPAAEWRAICLGAVFKATARSSWGLGDARAEGIADCEARAQAYGLGPMRWPDPWPTSDLTVARAMTFAERQGLLKPFALQAMRLSFHEAADLAQTEVVLEAGRRAGVGEAELGGALGDPEIKQALRAATDEALARGVFGVPTVIAGDELFWGDDRLEHAAAAVSHASAA